MPNNYIKHALCMLNVCLSSLPLWGYRTAQHGTDSTPYLTAGTDLNAELATVVATKSTAAAPDQSLTQTMLGMSLGLIDVSPSAKRWLASHMMFGLR